MRERHEAKAAKGALTPRTDRDDKRVSLDPLQFTKAVKALLEVEPENADEEVGDGGRS
jgi:hypothetical protein